MEHYEIDRNELQIHTNSQKGAGTKMAEKLNNFERKKKKKNQISSQPRHFLMTGQMSEGILSLMCTAKPNPGKNLFFFSLQGTLF